MLFDKKTKKIVRNIWIVIAVLLILSLVISLGAISAFV
jgi:hypothetical protein